MVAFTKKEKNRDSEEFDTGIKTYYEKAFEAAVRANLLFQDECAQTAWDEKDVITPAGKLKAVIDQDEYFWVAEEYGADCWKNADFINCYQKYRGQSFLGPVSKEIFSA